MHCSGELNLEETANGFKITGQILGLEPGTVLNMAQKVTLIFQSTDNFFCFILMLKCQSFLSSKVGSKFWWLPWFPAVFYPGQTFCTRVYSHLPWLAPLLQTNGVQMHFHRYRLEKIWSWGSYTLILISWLIAGHGNSSTSWLVAPQKWSKIE